MDEKWSFLSCATMTTRYLGHTDEVRLSVLASGVILNARLARLSIEDMRTLADLLNEGADELQARQKWEEARDGEE